MAGGSCVEAGTPNPADPCQACLPVANGNGWSQDDANVTCDSLPYWAGVQRSLPRTPYDHENAVSCHNCYASSLSATLDKIHAAQASGADLIELDIKDEGGTVYVQHDDTGSTSAPRFAEVLADPGLKAGNQLLFIETKETAPSESYLRAVLDQLAAAGYGVAGRPVVLRTFDSLRDNLIIARKLLATPTYAAMRPHVRKAPTSRPCRRRSRQASSEDSMAWSSSTARQTCSGPSPTRRASGWARPCGPSPCRWGKPSSRRSATRWTPSPSTTP
jgi:hypothetical protein